MGQDLALPDWAKNKPAPAFASLNPLDDTLSEGIGQSYPVIGYKGKNWSFRYRGEKKSFIRPDDGTPAAYLDVIILGQAKTKSKSYYLKYDPNNADGGRPVCSSIDGLTPDPDVTSKQSDSCALCPRNAWKADPQTGRKGRDCTDYKRLAVLVLPTQTSLIYPGEAPLLEPAFLRVPPASLNSLSIMGQTMAGQGFHYSSYVTRITFDPNEAHPKMVFRPLQGLSDAEAPMILAMRTDMQVSRIINGGFSEGMRTLAEEGSMTLPPSTVPTGLSSHPSTSAAAPPPQRAGASLGIASAPLATHNGMNGNPEVPSKSAPILIEGEVIPTTPTTASVPFGGAQSVSIPPPIQTKPVSSTIEDTGSPEAADDDLDAMIARELAAKK